MCAEFQFPTMPATCQKVCDGGGGGVVLSLAQAEQLYCIQWIENTMLTILCM